MQFEFFRKSSKKYNPVLHLLVTAICLWSIYAQMTYRVPGRFIFLLIPWLGIALTLFNIILPIKNLVFKASNDATQRLFTLLEWCSGLLIRIFVYYSLFLYANAKLDHTVPIYKTTQIVSISGAELDLGKGVSYSWATLASWSNPKRKERILLNYEEEEKLWGGEDVVIELHPGYFKIPWISSVKRDDEKYAKEVIKLMPTASSAWQQLIAYYIDHKIWWKASKTGKEYLKLFPDDCAEAVELGGILDVAGEYHEGIQFLEYAVSRKPTYSTYQLLGWGLSYSGNPKRAAEVLEFSINLDPDDWEAYYHLGYVYSDLGKPDKAIENFQKVLDRQPDFPEVASQIAELQNRVKPVKHLISEKKKGA